MKSKNHYVYSTDPNRLKELAEEYRDYCGREVEVEDGRIVVLALPRKKVKKKDDRKRDSESKEDSQDRRTKSGPTPQTPKTRA